MTISLEGIHRGKYTVYAGAEAEEGYFACLSA
jgi:hypothetical protein